MRSIQTKLTVIMLAIFVIALGTLGGLNYWKARDIVYKSTNDEIRTLALYSAGDVNDWLEAHKLEVAALALAPVLQTGNVEQIRPFLVDAVKANGRYETMTYITPQGMSYNSRGGVVDMTQRVYFQKALKGEVVVSDPLVSAVTGGLVTVVASPVKSAGRITGVFTATMSLAELSKKIGEVKIGKTGYAYMLQGDGVTIANPNKDLVMKDNPIKNDKLPPSMRAATERMVKGETGVTVYEYSGVEKMVGYAPVKSTGWALAVSLPVAEATEELAMLTWISLATIVTVLLVAAIIIVWFSRKITKPIIVLEGAVKKIAGGDLSQVNLSIESDDEIGRLGKNFEQMALNMRGLIKQIHSDAEQLAASSEELTASAEQCAQATNHVAIAMTEVAGGANAQLAATADASAVVDEMSAGIEQIAANANLVSGQSDQAAGRALEGGASVDKAISQMGRIEQTVNSSAGVVAKLGDRSKEIGQIVDTISGIAGQTNLLALNAAIEAARAGEQGRGFAVVAEEVRKLAEQSEEAAKKIANLIGEIQTDTDKAVIAMNEGTREVKTGADVVNAAGVAFREIAGLVTEVSDQVKQMSAAIQQMATGSQQIVGSVKKIDDLSKKSASEAQNVSAASEEQLASMEEISTSSRALATLAQNLQTQVAKFRV